MDARAPRSQNRCARRGDQTARARDFRMSDKVAPEGKADKRPTPTDDDIRRARAAVLQRLAKDFPALLRRSRELTRVCSPKRVRG
jgi:hypothetical protein